MFEAKSRVSANIRILDWSTIGAKCTVLPAADFQLYTEEDCDTLPTHTIVFGPNNQRRLWSGDSKLQAKALHAKHLAALREVCGKSHQSLLLTKNFSGPSKVDQTEDISRFFDDYRVLGKETCSK